MATHIEADYLVIGAGAMGLAFLDTVLTSNPAATFALVDKYVSSMRYRALLLT